jgi:hypothetical protein
VFLFVVVVVVFLSSPSPIATAVIAKTLLTVEEVGGGTRQDEICSVKVCKRPSSHSSTGYAITGPDRQKKKKQRRRGRGRRGREDEEKNKNNGRRGDAQTDRFP